MAALVFGFDATRRSRTGGRAWSSTSSVIGENGAHPYIMEEDEETNSTAACELSKLILPCGHDSWI
jgi:hypothetical protein